MLCGLLPYLSSFVSAVDCLQYVRVCVLSVFASSEVFICAHIIYDVIYGVKNVYVLRKFILYNEGLSMTYAAETKTQQRKTKINIF